MAAKPARLIVKGSPSFRNSVFTGRASAAPKHFHDTTWFHTTNLTPEDARATRVSMNEVVLEVSVKGAARAYLDAEAEVSNRLRAMQSLDEVLRAAPEIQGVSSLIWVERLVEHGAAAVAPVRSLLEKALAGAPTENNTAIVKGCLTVLRYAEVDGERVLLDIFPRLSEEYKAYACTALGLMGAQGAADTMWSFFNEAVVNRTAVHFVGALWGLIDLGDARAADGLARLLEMKRYFYELYGFVSVAGDQRCLASIFAIVSPQMRDPERADLNAAVLALYERLGPARFERQLRESNIMDGSEDATRTFLSMVAGADPSQARDHFAHYFARVEKVDVKIAFVSLMSELEARSGKKAATGAPGMS